MTAATARVLDTAQSGRAMTGVLAIMLFLTVLAAAGGVGAGAGAAGLARTLAGQATVQIVAADPATRDALATRVMAALRTSGDVTRAVLVPRAELARLLGPWLGEAAAADDLPVPALIDVTLASRGDAAGRVRATLARITPAAALDVHGEAMAGVVHLLRALTILSGVLVVLMIAASAAVVMLAVRAGLAAHRLTIEVMHGLGATDAQIAGLFQRRIARDTATAAAIGGLAGWATVAMLGTEAGALGSEVLGSATLGQGGWIAIVALPIAFVAFAVVIAHVVVVRALERTV